jgi:hypothetical protein
MGGGSLVCEVGLYYAPGRGQKQEPKPAELPVELYVLDSTGMPVMRQRNYNPLNQHTMSNAYAVHLLGDVSLTPC